MPVPPAPRRTTLTLGLLTGILAASTAAIFIRFAQAEGAASIVIAAARLTLAVLVLAPFTLTRYRADLSSLGGGKWGLALLSGLFLALHFASWISSLEYTSIASSVVLVSTTPLWVAILAPLVLRERVGRTALLGLGLALTGGVIIGLSDACTWQNGRINCPPIQEFLGGKAFLGDFLALCGAWMGAGYLLMGRKLRANLPLLPYIFIVYGMAALVLIVIMLVMGKSPFGLPPPVYLWFFLLALIPQLLGHSIFNWALKYLPVSFVSVTLLGEPIGSTIFAFIIFREAPGWIKFAGAFFLLAGIWLAGKNELSKT
jgi:drug/metabolite transporter (DMT)-like permease